MPISGVKYTVNREVHFDCIVFIVNKSLFFRGICMNLKFLVIAILSIFIIGCANTRPIIDTKGIDMRAYDVDFYECQQYAEQISAGEEAAVDAGVGAAFGWALSKVTGGDSKKSASVGALVGGSKGLGKAAQEKEQIVRNCLRGRGYKVLN